MKKLVSIAVLSTCVAWLVGIFLMEVNLWLALFIIGISTLLVDILYALGCFPKDDPTDHRHWSHSTIACIMHYFMAILFWIIGITFPIISLVHWLS